MRLRGLFIVWLLFSLPAVVKGAEAAAHFGKANQLYEKGDYKGAIAEYQRLLRAKTNSVSANLLFNLGNAYFKNGQPGHAIANYRRAAALSPRDPDIQANLNYARDSITAAYQEPPYHRLLTWFRLNEITIAVLLFWWSWLGLLILKVLLGGQSASQPTPEGESNERPGFWRRVRVNPVFTRAIFVLFLISAAFLFIAYAYQNRRTAVVVRETGVRFGPLEESQTAFTLREGAELPVLARRPGWLQIGDASRQGWIPERVAIVTP